MTLAELKSELEHLAEEELCHECRSPLTPEEQQQGYVCLSCIHDWMESTLAMNLTDDI